MKSGTAGSPTARSHWPASKVLRRLRLPKSLSDQMVCSGRPSAWARAWPISTYRPGRPGSAPSALRWLKGRLAGSAHSRSGVAAGTA